MVNSLLPSVNADQSILHASSIHNVEDVRLLHSSTGIKAYLKLPAFTMYAMSSGLM